MVTPLSVALLMPWMAAPAALVRLPPLIVEPSMTTEEEASALEIVPPALLTVVSKIWSVHPLGSAQRAAVGHVPGLDGSASTIVSVPPPVASRVPCW